MTKRQDLENHPSYVARSYFGIEASLLLGKEDHAIRLLDDLTKNDKLDVFLSRTHGVNRCLELAAQNGCSEFYTRLNAAVQESRASDLTKDEDYKPRKKPSGIALAHRVIG